MTSQNFKIQIDKATSLDWLELKKQLGDDALERPDVPASSETFSPFKEPVSATIVVTIAAVSSAAAFAAWVCKQRELRRTTLKMTITSPEGTVTTIDLTDESYYESKGDTKLISDLVKAGLKATQS